MLQEPKYPVNLEKISDDAPQDICRMYFHVFSTIFDFMNPYCAVTYLLILEKFTNSNVIL